MLILLDKSEHYLDMKYKFLTHHLVCRRPSCPDIKNKHLGKLFLLYFEFFYHLWSSVKTLIDILSYLFHTSERSRNGKDKFDTTRGKVRILTCEQM